MKLEFQIAKPNMQRPKGPPINLSLSREVDIAKIEAAIASRWYRKDSNFRLIGMKKDPISSVARFDVYRVDSAWIQDNLDVTFGSGGHGLVHTFIPLNEIWVDDASESWESITYHEAIEFHFMLEENMSYWDAHQESNLHAARVVVGGDNLEQEILAVAPEREKDVSYA